MLDPSRLIVVRALWGRDTPSHGKALHDFKNVAPANSELIGDSLHSRVIAFGQHNYASVIAHPFYQRSEVVLADEALPPGYKPSPDGNSDGLGRLDGGISTWWHKIEAIRLAAEIVPQPAAVLWLDCDVICRKTPDEALLNLLDSGPAFQSCNYYYPRGRAQARWRKDPRGRRTILHGGCYYVRGREIISSIQAAHIRNPGDNDEMLITRLLDEWGFSGVHNPLLYTAVEQEPPGEDVGYFRQAPHVRLQRFIREHPELRTR